MDAGDAASANPRPLHKKTKVILIKQSENDLDPAAVIQTHIMTIKL